jgi:hypothetical protein
MERSNLVERKECAYLVVVGGVIRQQMAKVPLPEHHDMVKAFASDRSNQTFNTTILPRRAWRDWPVANAHSSQPAGDLWLPKISSDLAQMHEWTTLAGMIDRLLEAARRIARRTIQIACGAGS